MTSTKGISPKAILAFCFPAIASVGGALGKYIITGHLDTVSIRLAAGGLLMSGLSALGAWLGHPGELKMPGDAAVALQPATLNFSTGMQSVASSAVPLDGMAGTMGPRPTLNGPHAEDEEPGDLFDGLPHHAITDPSTIPPDNVDPPHDDPARSAS